MRCRMPCGRAARSCTRAAACPGAGRYTHSRRPCLISRWQSLADRPTAMRTDVCTDACMDMCPARKENSCLEGSMGWKVLDRSIEWPRMFHRGVLQSSTEGSDVAWNGSTAKRQGVINPSPFIATLPGGARCYFASAPSSGFCMPWASTAGRFHGMFWKGPRRSFHGRRCGCPGLRSSSTLSARMAPRMASTSATRSSRLSAWGIEHPESALSRHRRRHVYCAGMGVPVLEMTAPPGRSS